MNFSFFHLIILFYLFLSEEKFDYHQLIDLSPIFLASAISFAFGYVVSGWLGLRLYVDALVKVVLFATIYIGWSLVFKPEPYAYALSIVRTLKSKKSNK